jgi:hypothetical protein
MISTSYPMQSIAKQFNLEYGDVLVFADMVTAKRPHQEWHEGVRDRIKANLGDAYYAFRDLVREHLIKQRVLVRTP